MSNYKDYKTGIESDSTDGIHDALKKCRTYLRYAHHREGVFPMQAPPSTLLDCVGDGKLLLNEIRRVLWKYRLSFICNFTGRESFTVVFFYWRGKETEWIAVHFPIYIPRSRWTVPASVAGRWVLAQSLIAFLGVAQPPGYENLVETLVSNELEETNSVPTLEDEQSWELGKE